MTVLQLAMERGMNLGGCYLALDRLDVGVVGVFLLVAACVGGHGDQVGEASGVRPPGNLNSFRKSPCRCLQVSVLNFCTDKVVPELDWTHTTMSEGAITCRGYPANVIPFA